MPKPSRRSSQDQPLALTLLAADHRDIEDLFRRYEREKGSDDNAKRWIAKRLCDSLAVHAQVEEELLYPWLREALDEDGQATIEEAQVEHNAAKDLIAQIEAADDVDAAYDAMVKVLGEYVRHHVREEESRLFPAVSGQRDALDEIGQEIASRKAELIEELGMLGAEADEGDEGAQQHAHSRKERAAQRPQRVR